MAVQGHRGETLVHRDSVARESSGDTALQAELAAAYEKVGDVQGSPFVANLGHTAAAAESDRKALVLEQGVASRAPDGQKAMRALATGHYKLADVQASTGQTAPGIESSRSGLALAERMADSSLRHRGYLRLGDILISDGKPVDALESYRRALAAVEALAAKSNVTGNRQSLAQTVARVGDALVETGEPESALAHYSKAMEIRQTLLEEVGRTPAARRSVMLMHQMLGSVLGNPYYLNLGDAAAAASHYRTALRMGEELASEDPNNARARTDLAIAHWKLGAVLQDSNPRQAADSFRQAIALTREAIAKAPNNTDHRRNQTYNLIGLGHALRRQREFRGARESLEQALSMQQELSEADPARAQFEDDIPITLLEMGDLDRDIGDSALALETYRRAGTVSEHVAAGHPSDLRCSRYLAECYDRIGDSHRTQRQWQEATAWYRKSLAVWESWRARGVSNPYTRQRSAGTARSLQETEALLKGK